MSSALEEVAATAEEVASDQRRVARRARTMQRRRDQGWSWARILDREGAPGLLELLRGSTRRLSGVTGRLARVLARELSGEGESQRRIAQRLGVTHQRISTLLKGEECPPADPFPPPSNGP